MDKTRLNGSGYIDNTAHEAINNAERESKSKQKVRDEAAEILVRTVKEIIRLAGFKLIGRIQFEDQKTGKKYL